MTPIQSTAPTISEPTKKPVNNNVAYGEKDGTIVIDVYDAMGNSKYAYCDQSENEWEAAAQFEDPLTKNIHNEIKLVQKKENTNNSLNYKVYVEEDGDYYLSFHSNSKEASADSFYIMVNGEFQYYTEEAMTGGSDIDHNAVGAAWFYCDKQKIHLNKGINILTIDSSEYGLCLRQLMLSDQKPMPARYMYFESQKNAEWLEKSKLVSGHISLNLPDEINLAYGESKTIPISAVSNNNSDVIIESSTSTDAVEIVQNKQESISITAKKGGYAIVRVIATAENCMDIIHTICVNVSHLVEGEQLNTAPKNLRTAPATESEDSITVVWDKPDNYENVSKYVVFINGEEIADRAANKTHYMAEHLEPDCEYEFCVSAVYNDGKSVNSPVLHSRTRKAGEVIDVTDQPYNAIGDGVTMDTEAIQKAIDDCPYGGTVLIPEGKVFKVGALDLKSHMTFRVDGELKGSENPNDYTNPNLPWDDNEIGERVLSRFEGWELLCLRSLINIGELKWQNRKEITCEDVTICGNGKITGGGTELQTASIKMAEDNGWAVGITNTYLRSRGFLINITQTKNVHLTGVSISDSPCWTVHMIYSDTVTTHGVKITSDILNGDGWDPDSSRNLMLFDSEIITGDDCVAIKSGKNPEGDVVNIPTENVEIFDLNCTGGHGLAMGSEISGGINNIYIHDCIVKNTLYGLQLKGTEKRGGGITNLIVKDCTLNLLLIKSNVPYNADGDAAEDAPLFANLTFKNINVEGAIEIAGFDRKECHNHYVTDTVFENVTVGTKTKPSQKILMEYCDGISFDNVSCYDGAAPQYTLQKKNYNITVDGNDIL